MNSRKVFVGVAMYDGHTVHHVGALVELIRWCDRQSQSGVITPLTPSGCRWCEDEHTRTTKLHTAGIYL